MTTDPDATSSTPTPDQGGANAPPKARAGIGSRLYKLALAGVGALILAQEEIEAAWKRARREPAPAGDDAGGDGAGGDGAGDRASAAAEPTDEKAAEAPDGSRVWQQIDAAIARVLRTLPIPTREEVDAVSARLDELAARIEARSRR